MENVMDVLRHSLRDLVTIELKEAALGKLPWKDFGNGLSMSRLARNGARELVLYRIQAGSDSGTFLPHEHPGGEWYLVLKGKIEDETGIYSEGDLVYLPPKSIHCPRAMGETLVLVLWPEGVKILD